MTILIENIPYLLKASFLTIQLTLISLIIGLIIGFFFSIMRLSKNFFLYNIAYYYSFIFRGTPLLVQIFIIYFGLAQLEFIRDSILWAILKKPFWCAIIAFSLNTGAYTSEILRAAFEKVEKNIIETGKSLGMSKFNIFYKIKLPIAIKQSVPAYGN